VFDVRVSDDFIIDGLAIWVSLKDGDSRRVLRLGGDRGHEWQQVEPATATEPTLQLPGEAARALLDALLRHYEGASDMHTVRSDLLHERGRVDKLIDVISQIALESAGP
jgi:hypothetical protein